MNGLEVALCLYEREVEPRPDKLSHGRQMWFLKDREKNELYSHSLCNFGVLLKCTGVWCIFLTPTGHLLLKNAM